MNFEKQKLTIVILAVVLIGEVLAITGIALVYFNQQFFNERINIIETYIGASTAFFGSFFSVLAVLLLFQFVKYREKQKEVQQTRQIYQKLKKEYEHNFSVLTELGLEIANGSSELAKLLKENQKIRELFLLSIFKLDFTIFDAYFDQLDWQQLGEELEDGEEYLESIEKTNQLRGLCQAIATKAIDTEENLKPLLQLITQKISLLKGNQTETESSAVFIETVGEYAYLTETPSGEMIQE